MPCMPNPRSIRAQTKNYDRLATGQATAGKVIEMATKGDRCPKVASENIPSIVA